MLLPIDHIHIRPDARTLDEATVLGLSESIANVGLINAIRVRPVDDQWELIAGGHRLEAHKRLGLFEIEAVIANDDDLRAELAMIDENLCRAELSPVDRAKQTARRKAIYLELHPETAAGVAQAAGMNRAIGNNVAENISATSFDKDAAAKTGQSDRNVRLYAERGEKIADDVLAYIQDTELDTVTYLDKLKRLWVSDQMDVAKRDLADRRRKDREVREGKNKRKSSSPSKPRGDAKIQADVKSRAALEVAEMIAEHVPGEWWDAIKSNLYAAGAKNIADALTNITGESIMDRRYGT